MRKNTSKVISIVFVGIFCGVLLTQLAQARTAAPMAEIEPIDIMEPTDPIVDRAQMIAVPSPVTPPIIIVREETIKWPSLKLLDSTLTLSTIQNSDSCVTPTPGMIITSDTILCAGNTYSNSSVATTFITIDADNVTLDCQGSELADTTTNHLNDGVIITPGRSNVTIQNCVFRNMFNSILAGSLYTSLAPIDSLTIQNNTFYNEVPYWNNMLLQNVTNSEIAFNVRSDANQDRPANFPEWQNSTFLNLWESSNTDIHHNTVHNTHGIHLAFASHHNTVHDNLVTFSGEWIHVGGEEFIIPAGIEIDRAAHTNTIYQNTIDPVVPAAAGISLNGYTAAELLGDAEYAVAAHDNTIINNFVPQSESQFLWVITITHESYNNTIANNAITYSGILLSEAAIYEWQGAIGETLYLPHDNNYIANTINCNNISQNLFGIALGNGSTNVVVQGNAIDGCGTGVIFFYISGEEFIENPIVNAGIYDNTITNSIGDGITAYAVMSPSYNTATIQRNYLENNGNQTAQYPSKHGIKLQGGSNSLITDNILINNGIDDSGTMHPLELAFDAVLDINGRGNYYNDYDEPSEGCFDTNNDYICDTPREFNTIFDNYPITNQDTIYNQPPTIESIDPVVINELEYAVITIHASDPDGDPLTYSVDNSNFTSMEPCWPGRHAFSWATDGYSAGSYTVNAVVSDGFYEVVEPVSVTVNNTCRLNKWGVLVCSSVYKPLACY